MEHSVPPMQPPRPKAPNACSLPAILNPAPSPAQDEPVLTPLQMNSTEAYRYYPAHLSKQPATAVAGNEASASPNPPLAGLRSRWSGERFLLSPLDEQPPLSAVRDESPELDMTSAYAFNQSKAAAAVVAVGAETKRAPDQEAAEAAAKKLIHETLDALRTEAPKPKFQIGRISVGIKDLVDAERSAFKAEPPKNLKRKAEDISSTSPEEETWAEVANTGTLAAGAKDNTEGPGEAGPSGVVISTSTVALPSVPEQSAEDAPAPAAAVATAPAPSTAGTEAGDSRPFKKLRGAAEAFAYAAIGGAAVGVALVSALIATAPAI